MTKPRISYGITASRGKNKCRLSNHFKNIKYSSLFYIYFNTVDYLGYVRGPKGEYSLVQ